MGFREWRQSFMHYTSSILSMMKFDNLWHRETSPEEQDFERLKILFEKRKTLQTKWSQFFGEIQHLDSKYPASAHFDPEAQKFRSDRGFMSAENQASFVELNRQLGETEVQRNEVDRELLTGRLELGKKYLDKVLQEDGSAWRVTKDLPNLSEILEVKEWRLRTKDADAIFSFSGALTLGGFQLPNIPPDEFFSKDRRRELHNTPISEDVQRLRESSATRYEQISFSFQYKSRDWSFNKDDWSPGLSLSFDRTGAHVYLPLTTATVFPEISSDIEEQGKSSMVTLAKKLGALPQHLDV